MYDKATYYIIITGNLKKNYFSKIKDKQKLINVHFINTSRLIKQWKTKRIKLNHVKFILRKCTCIY